jgi:GT2 family glycosyltransferase
MRAEGAEVAPIETKLTTRAGMSLEALYDQHRGKVADKWSAYLREYDRILGEYRHRPVRLLEIGVQNGGSLELWADYFARAEAIIGCDLNADCEKLRYEDARISVIIGDANSDRVQRLIVERAQRLDIVIDDGSHRSGDVVRSFARYFPLLADGGAFIIEDLHCSYLQEYDGGLFHPHSSMTFLKRLADVVNHEHWGVARGRAELVRGILQQHGLQLHERELGRIHSIEFSNSLCVIRKAATDDNLLGSRVVVGDELVAEDVLDLQGMIEPSFEDQSSNQWSTAPLPPEEELPGLREAVAPLARTTALAEGLQRQLSESEARVARLASESYKCTRELEVLERKVAKLDAERSALAQSLSDRELKLSSLALELVSSFKDKEKNERVSRRDRDANLQKIRRLEEDLAGVKAQLSGLQSSAAWKLTKPFRELTASAAKIGPPGGYHRASRRVRKVLRQGGLRGATRRMVELLLGRAKLAPVPMPKKALPQSHAKPQFDRKSYDQWRRRFDVITDEDRAAMLSRIRVFPKKPLISIVMPTYNANLEWLRQAIESVEAQLYPYWELCIVDDGSTNAEVRPFLKQYESERVRIVFREENGHISHATNSGFEVATGEWIALLDHDDLLREHALFWVVEAINKHEDVRLVYSDEDKVVDTGGRRAPYFKPDWNPDLFLSHNMICHLGVYRADLIREVGGCRAGFEGAQDYDLALRCIERLEAKQIHHVCRVLYSWRIHPESTAKSGEAKPYAVFAGQRALNEHFERIGVRAVAEVEPSITYRARYEMPAQEPLVTLIVPTRNAEALVRQCVESVVRRTSYLNYEILLVDNGSNDAQALHYFAELERDGIVEVLRDGRPFNYSALNNQAVRSARGEFICLLNNDIEALSPGWLTEMVSIGLQPGVGAVGARLWYPDDRLQHGGVILGIKGVAGHAHKGLRRGHRGYASRAALIQTVSAVTAACLLVRKQVFEEVGGLDEVNLKVAFNDVDFCLRLREAGYRNVWTPYAELYHHESATRGYENTPEKEARFNRERHFMQARWGEALLNDPAYNPNLTLEHEDFSWAWPPRLGY